jgi:hypothetical protein
MHLASTAVIRVEDGKIAEEISLDDSVVAARLCHGLCEVVHNSRA